MSSNCLGRCWWVSSISDVADDFMITISEWDNCYLGTVKSTICVSMIDSRFTHLPTYATEMISRGAFNQSSKVTKIPGIMYHFSQGVKMIRFVIPT